MSEDSIRDVLRALAETDASAEAPPEIEVRLRKEFRSSKRKRAWRQAAVWGSAAAAALLVFALANRRPPAAPISAVVVNTIAPSPPQAALLPAVPRTTMPVRRPASVRAPQPEEIVTEFFPLMDPAPTFERGQLLRVELPASAMQMIGLPVREEHLADPVQADVLVGEEGLPRAIRFVQFEMK